MPIGNVIDLVKTDTFKTYRERFNELINHTDTLHTESLAYAETIADDLESVKVDVGGAVSIMDSPNFNDMTNWVLENGASKASGQIDIRGLNYSAEQAVDVTPYLGKSAKIVFGAELQGSASTDEVVITLSDTISGDVFSETISLSTSATVVPFIYDLTLPSSVTGDLALKVETVLFDGGGSPYAECNIDYFDIVVLSDESNDAIYTLAEKEFTIGDSGDFKKLEHALLFAKNFCSCGLVKIKLLDSTIELKRQGYKEEIEYEISFPVEMYSDLGTAPVMTTGGNSYIKLKLLATNLKIKNVDVSFTSIEGNSSNIEFENSSYITFYDSSGSLQSIRMEVFSSSVFLVETSLSITTGTSAPFNWAAIKANSSYVMIDGGGSGVDHHATSSQSANYLVEAISSEVYMQGQNLFNWTSSTYALDHIVKLINSNFYVVSAVIKDVSEPILAERNSSVVVNSISDTNVTTITTLSLGSTLIDSISGGPTNECNITGATLSGDGSYWDDS